MKANGPAEPASVRQFAKTRRERKPHDRNPPSVAEEARASSERVEDAGVGAVSGAIAGAAAGIIAGPVGAVAGGAIGAVAGAAAGLAMAEDHQRRLEEDEELDREIGVSQGSMGAPNLKHPPAKVGAYSSGSAGGGPVSSHTPASGPISGTEE